MTGKFMVGDVVYLASNPETPMTVVEVGLNPDTAGGDYRVQWVSSVTGDVHAFNFWEQALRPYSTLQAT